MKTSKKRSQKFWKENEDYIINIISMIASAKQGEHIAVPFKDKTVFLLVENIK